MCFKNWVDLQKSKIVISVILYLILSFTPSALAVSPSLLPSAVTVEMYQLNTDGSIFVPKTPCTVSNQTAFGCTADPALPYPFSTSVVNVDIDGTSSNPYNRYLLDVVPAEVALTVSSQDFKQLSTLTAQAIAARTYAYWRDQYDYLENSNARQVFIPYYFDTLTESQQNGVLSAIQDVWYISPAGGSTNPIDALYGADNDGDTTDGYTIHLESVQDPISAAYGSDFGTNNGGMSSRGASRWGFGHTSSRGPVSGTNPLYPHDENGFGDPWSIRWDNALQILTHYFTQVDVRDAANNNQQITPTYRWTPLSIDWGNGAVKPPKMIPGTTYNATIHLQNTGGVAWGSDIRLSGRWQKPDGSIVNCGTTINPGTLVPGDDGIVVLPINPNTSFSDGNYILMIDAKKGSAFFADRESGKSWFTLNYPVCMGQQGCQIFFPIAYKSWPKIYFQDTFNPMKAGWVPYTTNPNGPNGYVGVYSLGGRDDNFSLYVTEQHGVWSYQTGAYITLNIPAGAAPLYLSYWHQRYSNDAHFHVLVDGTIVTNKASGPNWQQEVIDISTYATDGQVTLDFRVPNQFLGHSVLFDQISVYQQ